MSLINDALKKAQTLQVRTPAANPNFPRANQPAASTAATGPNDPLGIQTPPPAIQRPKTKSSQAGLVIAIGSVVLVVGLAAIGYVVYALFFMSTPADQAAPIAAAPAPTPAPAEVRPAVTPASTPPPAAPAANSTPAAATPATTAPVTATPPATAAQSPVTPPAATAAANPASATTPPLPAATAAAPEPAPAPAVEEEPSVPEHVNNPDPKISTWVAGITVTGIRGGDRPKALMNDRVFLEGDTVNHEFNLRLVKIDTRLLVFEDTEGNTYEYHF